MSEGDRPRKFDPTAGEIVFTGDVRITDPLGVKAIGASLFDTMEVALRVLVPDPPCAAVFNALAVFSAIVAGNPLVDQAVAITAAASFVVDHARTHHRHGH